MAIFGLDVITESLNLLRLDEKEKIKMKSIYFMLFLLFVSAKRRHHHERHPKRTHRGNYYKKVRLISKILSNDYFSIDLPRKHFSG